MVWGGLVVRIGVVVVIPAFGWFGIIWTLAAIAITVMNGYQVFGKKYVGSEINIEEESVENSGICRTSMEVRLQQLRNLYDCSLITEEEYENKK